MTTYSHDGFAPKQVEFSLGAGGVDSYAAMLTFNLDAGNDNYSLIPESVEHEAVEAAITAFKSVINTELGYSAGTTKLVRSSKYV